MQKRWVILFLVVAGILLVPRFFPRAPAHRPKLPEPDVLKILEAQIPVPTREEPVTNAAPIPAYEYPSQTDTFLLMIDPRWLEKHQGSYTLEEFQSRDGASLNIKSSWLTRDPDAPQAGIVLQQDAAEDAYRFRGAEVLFPRSGIGVSYEQDDETGETKALLKLDRKF